MDPTKPNFMINLTENSIPIVDIEKIKREEREKMFTYLPILREQGRIPNREINQILNQSKISVNTDPLYRSYSLNFFPNNK